MQQLTKAFMAWVLTALHFFHALVTALLGAQHFEWPLLQNA